ncbi:hypothetical protein JI739_10370 [Ramlibacter sp. AW1]|uniref:Uncharacterized protein n=1 Tax=Ramlibacter aurantiacus TaxID=2801330 RepID=A0A936ZIA7_9BURK|nr:hypothetical protein [Ramlibacter aurantiacus]MBL0420748.1 hypothetical protein [Ramlibacter aurantiacus]
MAAFEAAPASRTKKETLPMNRRHFIHTSLAAGASEDVRKLARIPANDITLN